MIVPVHTAGTSVLSASQLNPRAGGGASALHAAAISSHNDQGTCPAKSSAIACGMLTRRIGAEAMIRAPAIS